MAMKVRTMKKLRLTTGMTYKPMKPK